MDRERAPEAIGVVHVTSVGSPDEPESDHNTGDSMLQVGAMDGSVVFAFAVEDAVVSVALNTRQAYHMGMALMRARAAITRAARRASN